MDKFKEYSLSQVVHLSQNKFCSILKDRLSLPDMAFTNLVSDQTHSPILFNHNFADYSLDSDEYRIKVRAVDMVESKIRNIECKYLIGCEGVGSKIRESIHGKYVGPYGISDFLNIHFKSKQLGDAIKRKNMHAMLYFIYNTKIATILVNHNTDIGEFVLQTPFFPPIEDIKNVTSKVAMKMILQAINSDKSSDEQITKIDEILNIGQWKMSACASDTFGDHKKNVYIAGDSAHSIPPAGGYNMNAGISDVHNLAYKIADAEFNNNSGYLKDYDPERRFIGTLTAKFAHQNFKKGENVINQLKIDLSTFKNFFNTVNNYIPSFVSPSIKKTAVDASK